MIDHNPYQPPRAYVEDVRDDSEITLAGRGARLGAVLLDGVFISLILFLPLYMMGWWNKLQDPIFGFFAGQVTYVLLNGFLLFTQGQTIGKKLVGIRIIRSNGDHPNMTRSYGLRYFLPSAISVLSPWAVMIFWLVDSLFIFQKSRRCIHDLIADTVVIKA